MDEVPYLVVGTEVSAKYRGAFCEAKVKRIDETKVQCKVYMKSTLTSALVSLSQIVSGIVRVGCAVSVRLKDNAEPVNAEVQKVLDQSTYTVVFNDGDQRTLKRTQLVLKGARHFQESESLDRLPLTHPEHFGTPVGAKIKAKKRKRRVVGSRSAARNASKSNGGNSDQDDDAEEDDDDDNEDEDENEEDDDSASAEDKGEAASPPPRTRKSAAAAAAAALPASPALATTPIGRAGVGRPPASSSLVGQVMMATQGEQRRPCPVLICLPSANPDLPAGRKSLLVRSFRDNRFTLAVKKELSPFKKERAFKSDDKALKAAYEKALQWLETRELPYSWSRSELVGESSDSSGEESDESSVEDPVEQEAQDHWIAQLYSFMDDRSTPIGKTPAIGNKDLNLFRLYHLVKKFGGYNRVTSQLKWRIVHSKLGLPATSSTTKLKSAYQRYLLPFEDFDKKLGTSFNTGIITGGRLRGGQSSMASSASATVDVAGSSSTPAGSAGQSQTRNFLSAREKCQSGLATGKRPRVPGPTTGKIKDKDKAKDRDKDAASSCSAASTTAATAGAVAGDTASTSTVGEEQAPPCLSRYSSLFDRVETAPCNASTNVDNSKEADSAAAIGEVNSIATEAEAVDDDDDVDDVDNEANMDEDVQDDDNEGDGQAYKVNDKVRVRYGDPSCYKVYDGRIVKKSRRSDGRTCYHVHYFGWNQRYDEVITADRILGRCQRGYTAGRLNHGQPLLPPPPPPPPLPPPASPSPSTSSASKSKPTSSTAKSSISKQRLRSESESLSSPSPVQADVQRARRRKVSQCSFVQQDNNPNSSPTSGASTDGGRKSATPATAIATAAATATPAASSASNTGAVQDSSFGALDIPSSPQRQASNAGDADDDWQSGKTSAAVMEEEDIEEGAVVSPTHPAASPAEATAGADVDSSDGGKSSIAVSSVDDRRPRSRSCSQIDDADGDGDVEDEVEEDDGEGDGDVDEDEENRVAAAVERKPKRRRRIKKEPPATIVSPSPTPSSPMSTSTQQRQRQSAVQSNSDVNGEQIKVEEQQQNDDDDDDDDEGDGEEDSTSAVVTATANTGVTSVGRASATPTSAAGVKRRARRSACSAATPVVAPAAVALATPTTPAAAAAAYPTPGRRQADRPKYTRPADQPFVSKYGSFMPPDLDSHDHGTRVRLLSEAIARVREAWRLEKQGLSELDKRYRLQRKRARLESERANVN